jgi:hypothetical protein
MRQGKMLGGVTALVGVAILFTASTARAALVADLSNTGSATFNNAWFFVNDDHDLNPSNAFVRIQDANHDGLETGFNNNGPVSDDTKPGSYLLKLSQIPIVQYNGNSYFKFILDVGEPGGSKKPISMDDLKLYSFPMTPGNDTKAFGTETGFTLRYNINTPGHDNDVLLKDRTNGQGKNDLVALLPSFYTANDQWVMLYSKFGEHAKAEGSFEAWKIGNAAVVPEPATLLLIPGALLLLSRRRRQAR